MALPSQITAPAQRFAPARNIFDQTGGAIHVEVTIGGLLPVPKAGGIADLTEGEDDGGAGPSFEEAMTEALAGAYTGPQYQAFWECLRRGLRDDLVAFDDAEIPLPILKWVGRAGRLA